MTIRAYLLLDIVDGRSENVLRMLSLQSGIVFADRLGDRPDIIAIIEASDRRALAEVLMTILGFVDGMVKDLRLLVSQDNVTSLDHSALGCARFRDQSHRRSMMREYPGVTNAK